ncbi:MAG: uracil-DNA glycosylase [Gemmatimonadetes bacterium]|nr:uracil-DNA glycosylase [Gemmatimonadota bacterium]
MTTWRSLQQSIVRCDRCERLISHCRRVAREKRAAHRNERYWGKPVPDFGSPRARLLIVGLAPGAHGANRTGRMFTGDRSGDFLNRALHETGFANQLTSERRGDGLVLQDACITAAVHCAPPGNKPAREEFEACGAHLTATFDAMRALHGVVALGGIAFRAALLQFRARGWLAEGPAPRFGHGAFSRAPGHPFLLASYHPSQQNTFTGRLTPEMLRAVFSRARSEIEAGAGRPARQERSQ